MFMPEQIKLAVQRQDGGVTIVAFVTKSFYPNPDPETGEKVWHFIQEPTQGNIEAVLNKHEWKDGLAWTSYKIIEDTDIPSDRTFRDAWKVDADTPIVVDMPKAREIQKDRLRRARATLLAALDIEAIRADEIDDKAKKADIVARKQALRDVTDDPRIEAATTPEELKSITL